MKKAAAFPTFTLPSYYHLPTTVRVVLHVNAVNAASTAHTPQHVEQLPAAQANIHHLRDGDVVLFRVPRSKYWQARYKLLTGKWLRFSTKQRRLEDAALIACDRYDEARYRERMGLSPVLKRFADIASACVEEMMRDMAAGTGKRIYRDYIQVIDRYLVPYFGNHYLNNINAKDVAEFEAWRNQQMKRTPKSSTLLTFASAFNRIQQTAVARGWISERVPLPKLTVKGEKGTTRPAFTAEEVGQLRHHLATSHMQAEGRSKELRCLLRDLVEVLFLTGMRQGTESKNLRWKHIEWHTEGSKRYLRIWVSGKTGPRWLIAKHECVTALQRLHKQQPDIAHMDFEALIAAKADKFVFRFADGTQPYEFTAVFRRVLDEAGLTKGTAGTARSLYSLRHTYATLELLAGTDIHTLAKQMGTSVLMLERHYSKLTATLAAEQLA